MRRFLLSLGAAGLLVGALIFLLDPARLADQLVDTNLQIFALGLTAVIGALVCWGEASRRLFVAVGTPLSHRRALVAYGAGAFGKQVLPMGNAGGPAIMAFAFNGELELGYSRALAVVVVAEFLSLVASLVLAVAGLVVLLAVGTGGSDLGWLAVGVVFVIAGLVALIVVVRYRASRVTLAVTGTARLLAPVVGRVSRSIAEQLQPDRVEAAIQRYYETFRTVVGDGRAVLLAFALSQVGWILFALPLYTSAVALGVDVPLALALFMVPVAGLATVVPIPGGLGGVEVVLVGLLVALTVVELTTAGAVVILFRLCSYWFFVLICGVAATMAAVGVNNLLTPIPVSPTDAEENGRPERV